MEGEADSNIDREDGFGSEIVQDKKIGARLNSPLEAAARDQDKAINILENTVAALFEITKNVRSDGHTDEDKGVSSDGIADPEPLGSSRAVRSTREKTERIKFQTRKLDRIIKTLEV